MAVWFNRASASFPGLVAETEGSSGRDSDEASTKLATTIDRIAKYRDCAI